MPEPVTTISNTVKFTGIILKPVTWIYSHIKAASLSLIKQDVKIETGKLIYDLKYQLRKGRWARTISEDSRHIILGPDIEIADLEIRLPQRLVSPKLRLERLSAATDLHEVILPYLRNLDDGNEIDVTVVTTFDPTNYIERKTIVTNPRKQEIIFTNRLPYLVKQHEICLDITEPHPIKQIEIHKRGEEIGGPKILKLECLLVDEFKLEQIGKKFPRGISSKSLLGSTNIDPISRMKISVDFDPREEIKIIIHR